MASKNTVPEITVLRCNKCGSEVSGPNKDSVAETMKRHQKKKHGSQPFTTRAKKAVKEEPGDA